MTADSPSVESPKATTWPELDLFQRRVLGVLVEKAKTTPDVYPLSLNSLVSGCNQKSNRDPHLDLSDEVVENTLAGLQKNGLVTRITGGRVDRWRHNLYEVWQVDKVELAILAELLLRGPQTEGELRAHANRMEPIADLDRLREVLKPLQERGLVVYLGPEGRRGTILTHGFHGPEEWERLRSRAHPSEAFTEPAPKPLPSNLPSDSPAGKWKALEAELAATRAELAVLKDQVAQLTMALNNLSQQLGLPPAAPASQ